MRSNGLGLDRLPGNGMPSVPAGPAPSLQLSYSNDHRLKPSGGAVQVQQQATSLAQRSRGAMKGQQDGWAAAHAHLAETQHQLDQFASTEAQAAMQWMAESE